MRLKTLLVEWEDFERALSIFSEGVELYKPRAWLLVDFERCDIKKKDLSNTIFPLPFQKKNYLLDWCAGILVLLRFDGLLIGVIIPLWLVSIRYFSGRFPDCFSEHYSSMLFHNSTTLNSCSVQNSKTADLLKLVQFIVSWCGELWLSF